MNHCHSKKGFLLVLVLVFGSIFFMMASAFLGYVITQSHLSEAKYNKERALDIAEAGLDYYKWFLAHNPNDTTNGTAVAGPYVHTYNDPEGSAIGEFSLDIASSTSCGEVYAIDITSTGHTYVDPDITRTVYGRYARPTVAEFAYIINANVWAGADRQILGPYHSNGGIRMDGTNNSNVFSAVATWTCNSSFGCSPTQSKAGVFGAGSGSSLWKYPVSTVNFAGIASDFPGLKTKAQTSG